MTSLNQKMARGAAWMVLATFSNRALGLVSTLVLARLLVPADFGLVAMAMSVVAMLELITAFGFDAQLVSNRAAPSEHYHTAWTLNVTFTGVAACALILLAWPAAQFYEEPRLLPVIGIIGASLLLQGFENIGVVAFRKEMTFGREFAFIMGKRIAGVAVTIPIAAITRSYWALVLGIVTSRVAGVALSYAMHPFRPHFSLRSWRELLRFSRWLLVNNVLNFLNSRSTDFIIGKTGGPTTLGLYSLSYEIATLPTSEVVAPINRAVLPGYAQLSHDLAGLRTGYLDVMGAVGLFALPLAFGLAAVAEHAVYVMLGPNWASAAPLVSVIAFYGAFTAIDSNSYSAYLVLGKPSVATALATARVVILLPAVIVLSSRFGAIGAAWSLLAVGALLTPAGLLILFRMLRIRLREFLGILWRPALSATIMFVVVRGVVPDLADEQSWAVAAFHLVAGVAVGAVSYVATLLALWWMSGRSGRVERQLLARARALMPRRSPAA